MSAQLRSTWNRSFRTSDDTPFTEQHVFDVLSNERRRYALHFLKQHDEDVATLRELAEQVAAWEHGKRRRELSAGERKSVKNALHQFHLPKMANLGVVEYDSGRGLVTLTDAADTLEVYVEVVPKWDVPWGLYYLVFTAIYAAVVSGRWAGVEPLAGVPWAAFTVFFVVAIGVSALTHTYVSVARNRLGTTDPEIEVSDVGE